MYLSSTNANRQPEPTMTNTTLKAMLISLVELSKTNGNAVDYLHEQLRLTTDRNEIQQIKLAIRHAERNTTRQTEPTSAEIVKSIRAFRSQMSDAPAPVVKAAPVAPVAFLEIDPATARLFALVRAAR